MEKAVVHPKEFLEAIQKFRLLDDTFFHSCFEGREDCMELLLRIILEKPFLIVTEMHAQQEVPNLYGREVRFDVFARDADGTEYNIEVQRSNEGAIPKRARFHASMLDTMSVEKGKSWKDFPPTMVIFITEGDVFGGNLPIYHAGRYIKEMNFQRFEDESDIIYVNASYQEDTPLGWLLHDFRCTDPAEMHYKLLADRANFFKTNEHGVSKMCRVMEEIEEKGIAKGVAKATRNIIQNFLAKQNLTYEEIAAGTNTTVEEVARIAKESGLAY
ncbi:PD-(D/E)XK nuclease family transposase [Selenomonas sp.]|uniref:PD-(D/E)XK nuclease family transposase n=2 Tax=Selenomonas sp. TaxID=2053611 RepID=UPI002A74E79D|nr:PD-(D/E)XK nuclease family transposase [Selenomonas sp.]MCI6087019.1 PD-(D/E)XK nuclease family transposase [Selenomonas sp.]MDY3297245.1 PD-(D/E)XK nuclease family transposase [Selenomonas sp.]MDY4415388.1 PD-(D/E)XK nuclease family transposase [Selenomonas sp.]